MMQRIWRLRGTPQAIAMGCACGVFSSFTPFVGFHFIVAGVLAAVCRGSIIASALGTFFGNPITFPLIWIPTYKVGNYIIGGTKPFSSAELRSGFAEVWLGFTNFSGSAFSSAVTTIWPFVKPMLVGAVPLGAFFAILSYVLVKRMVEAYQSERRLASSRARPQ